jgi:hypothetical protein
MDVFALTMRLKAEGAALVKASLATMQSGIKAAEKDAKGLDKSLGGLSKAFKALGAAAAVGVTFKKIIDESSSAQFAQAQLASALKSTGYAAGQSVKDLNDHASALAQLTMFEDDAITGAQNLLLTFTKIQGDTFPKATEAVLNMSQAMGTDLKGAAIQVGKALNDPILGVTALGRAGVQFTQQQKDQIKAMVEAGNTAQAQTIILKELETQFGGSAEAARNTLGGALAGLKNDFGNLFEVAEPGTADVVRGLNDIGKMLRDLKTWMDTNKVFPIMFRELVLLAQALADTVRWFGLLGKQASATFGILRGGVVIMAGVKQASTKMIEAGVDLIKTNNAEYDAIQRTMGALIDQGRERESATRAMSRFTGALDDVIGSTTQFYKLTGPSSGRTGKGGGVVNEEDTPVLVNRVTLLTELAGMVQLSTAEVMELSGAESNLLTRLLAGNVSLEQRVKLNKELLAVQGAVSAQFDMMLSKPPTALAATATEGRAPIVPKAVSINPAIIAQVRANADAMGREMDAAAKDVLDKTGINITEQFTSIFADALGAGFEAAFATGKISDGFKAFGRAMLAGLGGMLQAFGKQTLLASGIMKQIMVSFATLNPVQMAAAGIALIALGGALKGSASSIFGGGSAGGGASAASYSTSSSAMTAPRLPTLTYGPTSAAGAAGLSPMGATNITIIGPNDPVAQRAMQELITKANRRGNV